jgi:hypothetical protein
MIKRYIPASRNEEGKRDLQEVAEWAKKKKSKKRKRKAWRPSYVEILMV